jgi:hypothetical protein
MVKGYAAAFEPADCPTSSFHPRHGLPGQLELLAGAVL